MFTTFIYPVFTVHVCVCSDRWRPCDNFDRSWFPFYCGVSMYQSQGIFTILLAAGSTMCLQLLSFLRRCHLFMCYLFSAKKTELMSKRVSHLWAKAMDSVQVSRAAELGSSAGKSDPPSWELGPTDRGRSAFLSSQEDMHLYRQKTCRWDREGRPCPQHEHQPKALWSKLTLQMLVKILKENICLRRLYWGIRQIKSKKWLRPITGTSSLIITKVSLTYIQYSLLLFREITHLLWISLC